MKYISESEIINSWKNLIEFSQKNKNSLNKFFGLLDVLKNLNIDRAIQPNVQYILKTKDLSNSLQNKYYFDSTIKQFASEDLIYVIFPNNWTQNVLHYFLKDKNLPLKDTAIICMQNSSLPKDITNSGLKTLFLEEYHLSNIGSELFTDSKEKVDFSDSQPNRSKIFREIKKIYGLKESDRFTLPFDRSLHISNPGELTRGPFIQPLYAGQENLKCILLSSFNILEEYKISNVQKNVKKNANMLFTHPLNQILYGPPGTGKTYHTINRALEILGLETENIDRSELKSQFASFLENGQIVFSTFHQSMCYEDFIEGIKPLKPEKGEPIKYDIEEGIFKRISEQAKSNYENSKATNKNKLPFEKVFELLVSEWEDNPELKFPVKTPGYDYTILAFTNTSIRFRKSSGGTGHTLSKATLKELYYGKEFDYKQGVGIYYPGILAKLNSYNPKSSVEVVAQPYVLIIDEINRGNVSQIFGELITLLEEDKRIGNKEELFSVLPYSKEKFGVPPNLFIIGTMNTADRSVEAIDTALRRRFTFIEMGPKPELLKPSRLYWDLLWEYETVEWNAPSFKEKEKKFLDFLGANDKIWDSRYDIWKKMVKEGKSELQVSLFSDDDFTGCNLFKILSKINQRIEVLLNRDYLIGHSYFLGVTSIADLKSTFANKILPLLQEYFYGDYGKIGLVVGEGFFEKTSLSNTKIFSQFKDYDATELAEKSIYHLISISTMNDEEFMTAINTLITSEY
jgi:5-methylcytosine-specific restriction protein B